MNKITPIVSSNILIFIIGFKTIFSNESSLAQKIVSLLGLTLCAIGIFIFINKRRNKV